MGLPFELEVLHALSVYLPIIDIAGLVASYAHENTFTLAQQHFANHGGHFLDLSDLLTVVSFIYKNSSRARDVTARGPALLSYLRRMFSGLLPVEQWPERMQDPARRILTSCKGFYRTATWSFERRIDLMEDQYAFCECDNCRYETRPDVIEFLHDAMYVVHALEQGVDAWIAQSGGDHRQTLIDQFSTPGCSLGRKFELARALCQD
jgi:hypothetical protein